MLEIGKLSIIDEDIIIKDKRIIKPNSSNIIPYTNNSYLTNSILRVTANEGEVPGKKDIFISLENDKKTLKLTKIKDLRGIFTVLPPDCLNGHPIFKPYSVYSYKKLDYGKFTEDLKDCFVVKLEVNVKQKYPEVVEFRALTQNILSLKDMCLLYVTDKNLDTSRLPNDLREQL